MQGAGFGPFREFRYSVELAKELADNFAGIIALAELLELTHDARERVLGARNRAFGVVLTLLLEALMMSEKFFAEELMTTLTDGAEERLRTLKLDGYVSILRGHRGRGRHSV